MSNVNNLIDYAKRLIAERIIVEDFVDDATAAWRMSVCSACEHHNRRDNTCNLCGCFLDLKTRSKTNYSLKRMRSEVTHCPDGRWNDKHIADFYKVN